MKARNRLWLLGSSLVLLAASACASSSSRRHERAQALSLDTSETSSIAWIQWDAHAINGVDGRCIVVVGSSEGINNVELRKSAAREAARRKLGRVLSDFARLSMRAYDDSVTAGSMEAPREPVEVHERSPYEVAIAGLGAQLTWTASAAAQKEKAAFERAEVPFAEIVERLEAAMPAEMPVRERKLGIDAAYSGFAKLVEETHDPTLSPAPRCSAGGP